MSTDLQNIIDFIERHDSFVVVGHEEPDGDCLCSQLALGSLLTRRGKPNCLVSVGPFRRPEILGLVPHFVTTLDGCTVDPEAVFIVDCSTPQRIGTVSDQLGDRPVAVIDHHAAGEAFGDARLVDPKAPSVTYLIHKIMGEYGIEPTEQEADWLLFGLSTDTGYFRHLGAGTETVFATVADLVSAGASPKGVYYRMFGNRSFASRKYLGRLLERTKALLDGTVLLTWETLEDAHEFGPENRDSDTLYRELQAVAGCEAVVFVRAETENTCSVGLRSIDKVDVGSLARRMGGGGHKNAAGYDAEGTLEEVRESAASEITSLLDTDTQDRNETE